MHYYIIDLTERGDFMKFSKKYINDAIKDLKFESFTDIQTHVIPEALKRRDIIGTSETGSGKTHAFLLPLFEKLDESKKEVQVVILSPTRELAQQLYDVATHIASFSENPIDIRAYMGGKDRSREMDRLKKSQPQIVIGTPGKVHDLAIKENLLKVYKADALVIDEADMALDIGFLEDIDRIASTMDKNLHMMVFSATIPQKLEPFLRKYMTQPLEFHLSDASLKQLNIEHIFIRTTKDKADKMKKFDQILDMINPYLGMIFINKKEDIEAISNHLRARGLKAIELHGDLQARKRKQVIREIENLSVQYIVASDIAARGLDIKGVSHVINLDLPHDMDFYTHRVGRTGRMKTSGVAFTLYHDDNIEAFEYLNKRDVNILYREIKKGELVEKKKKDQFVFKRPDLKEPERKKNKKVKPGYKKKYHREREKINKKNRRKRG